MEGRNNLDGVRRACARDLAELPTKQMHARGVVKSIRLDAHLTQPPTLSQNWFTQRSTMSHLFVGRHGGPEQDYLWKSDLQFHFILTLM
jgi:hypothetical protein